MKITIACAQIQVEPGNPEANTKKALAYLEKARAQQADIVLFPELTIPGYLLGDLWEQNAFLRDCEAWGKELIAASKDLCIVFGNIALDPEKINEDGRIRKYNAAFVAQNGKLLHGGLPYPFISKTALPNYREFDDGRYFHSTTKLQLELPGTPSLKELLQPVAVTIRGQEVKLGIMLCEDGWTENYYYNIPQLLKQNGAQLLCNISCSPYTFHKNVKRHRIFAAQAKECGIPLVYCNSVGVQNNGKNIFTFDGCSTFYSADGQSRSDAPAFQETLLTAQFDPAARQLELNKAPEPEFSDAKEIYTALHYGASQFLKQIGLQKMTIGVSGGIDSAVTAAFYVDILGADNVLLANIPSRYNSSVTKNLAQQMAQALGTRYVIIPIQEVVDKTIEQLGQTPIHNYATGEDSKLTITPFATENIQARDRGARVIAGLAASFGGGFSCNSNKAEMTVGYATFYGDIAGVLALLGDLWKHQVYALGHYLNEEVFHKEVIPEQIFTIKPSAELSEAQTVGNGGDPLVYPYHDFLFRSFIEDWYKTSPEDLLGWYLEGTLEEHLGCAPGLVKELFPTPQAFIADLERWWKNFCGLAVAKRIQAPPILTISKRAYGYDHREAQMKPFYSRKYQEMKAKALSGANS
ncbi:NAD(+) synthase [Acidaminococcus sp. AM05-11]|jgi:NAD+ synthase (glutamine-hydrolysing)|uniref:NAD(+) synthase n=1 Tax=Acidaminococcus sp. AM05-11 TaxID=2291997 RepID=UPI000E4874A1|nr:NAD(+) synthase [Acidaminococcus sp. AM05-11]RHK02358.1 NAD(+) synthase [Acidaminococcus sp. AM05-11]